MPYSFSSAVVSHQHSCEGWTQKKKTPGRVMNCVSLQHRQPALPMARSPYSAAGGANIIMSNKLWNLLPVYVNRCLGFWAFVRGGNSPRHSCYLFFRLSLSLNLRPLHQQREKPYTLVTCVWPYKHISFASDSQVHGAAFSSGCTSQVDRVRVCARVCVSACSTQ